MIRVINVAVALLVCATLGGAEDYVRWVPVAASNSGLFGSHWTTDLSIFNRARDNSTYIWVAFLPDAEGVDELEEVRLLIWEPMTVLEIHDVVAELFGESRPGALRLRSNHPFEVSSRTFNVGGAEGSHGEGIPAVDPDDFGSDFVLMSATNIPGADGMRSNLGLVSRGSRESEVHILLDIPETGEQFGPVVVELGPYGWRQLDVFALFGLADRRVDSATVRTYGWFSLHGLFPYLSLVDTRSGDGSFILPVNGSDERTIPRRWNVSLTMTHSEGVEAFVVTHDSGFGPDTTVPDPESGYTVQDLLFTSPKTFCYTVIAMATLPTGGEVAVEVISTPEDDFGSRGRIRHAIGQAGPLRIDSCRQLN